MTSIPDTSHDPITSRADRGYFAPQEIIDFRLCLLKPMMFYD